MIILQLLALVMLIPLTALMLLVFNVYLRHWLYLLLISLFGLSYAALCGLVVHNSSAVSVIFIILSVIYVLRMRSLAKHLKAMNETEAYPLVRGSFRSKRPRLQLCFYIPLSCLNIFKWLPKRLNKEIRENLNLGVEITSLVDQLIGQSSGTVIEVNSEEISLILEVQ